MPSTCIVCKKTTKTSGASMHRFPPKTNSLLRQQWLKSLKLKDDEVFDYHRVCRTHFPNGDTTQVPCINLGKRFASPKKLHAPRGKRAVERASKREYYNLISPPAAKRRLSSSSPSPRVSGETRSDSDSSYSDFLPMSQLTTPPGEVLLSDYSLHELPSEESCPEESVQPMETEVLVNTALVARIEALESEIKSLQSKLDKKKPVYLRLENIAHSNSLVRFYTGFHSYEILLAFFEFLGPSVHRLNYWGSKNISGNRRKMKLDPLNQLFMTLMKLRLNTRERELSHRFGVSVSVISKYFITWICFLYNHLREIEWMPTVEQVKATLPHAFKDKYPKTFVIVDASEVFMETPTDLQLQSSSWSNYKHHNTFKFLVGCTPNGAVSFVSELYMGSISDVKLTSVSGLVDKLRGKSNISVMADRGFTVRDQLKTIGAELNIPPFLEGRGQLPASEVLEGRKIASLRIHVERVIGRIKNYTILKGTLPISLVRIANQIVCVCAWLVNFHSVLIPPPTVSDKDCEEVDEYFNSYHDSESDYDADTEQSDEETLSYLPQ